MKGFLLAAGNGTRLRPLTDNIPKCLVPIQGKPMLTWWLEWCAIYGIDEILINIHAHAERVTEFLTAYNGPVKVTMTHEPELLGSAGTLHVNRSFVDGEPEFAILYGDVLTNCRFDRMLEFHRRVGGLVTVGTYRVPNPTQCGILTVDAQSRIIEFEEKPEHPKSDMAFSGLLVAGPALMQAVPSRIPSDIAFDVLSHLVGQMHAFSIEDFVLDIGTLEKYERAQQEWPGIKLIPALK